MSSNLATKQDVEYLDRLMASRIDAVEGRVALQLQNLESRLIAKLGAMMTVLFGLAATVAALLR